MHSTLSKAVSFKGKSPHVDHHITAKIKLLQITSFSLTCQKQACGKEKRKGIGEKVVPCIVSLVDIALVSLKVWVIALEGWSCYDKPLLDEISHF